LKLSARRNFLRGLGAVSIGLALELRAQSAGATDTAAHVMAPWPADEPDHALTPWRPGCLDIHHIATGRGDSSLIIAPDGTTLMIDAGAMYAPPPADLDLKPSKARRPGEWIARYAQRQLRSAGLAKLDYLIVTHLHPDHVGDVNPDLPRSADATYQLTGVSDVAALLPIGVLLDRGALDYENVAIRDAPFARNYVAFVRNRQAAGGRVERLRPGADNQITLKNRAGSFPTFDVRNLAVNGEVWTGQGEAARSLFPAISTLKPDDVPDENAYSAALRLTYGRFSYFAAGDLTSNTFDGELPWRDVESRAARVAGPVDVALAAHHGLFDSTGADVVRALRPRVWLMDVWHVSHPNITTLERLFSQRLYTGPRDVFATALSPENYLVNERLTKRLSSSSGHIVIRVSPGGEDYRVVITSNSDESDRVRTVFGPYQSRGQ
jgi:beta-lactamase superfamily II metal-dependent hydrolase